MFNKNDYIIYGGMSVCEVKDIIEEHNIYSGTNTYYVLQPVYSDKNTIIKVPINNTKVFMRPVLSRDEVMSLIYNMDKKDIIWIDNDRQRNEAFKTILKNNVTEEIIQLVKSIYICKEDNDPIGRKLSKNDEEIIKSAQKLLEEEFASALGIEVIDVHDFIISNVVQ